MPDLEANFSENLFIFYYREMDGWIKFHISMYYIYTYRHIYTPFSLHFSQTKFLSILLIPLPTAKAPTIPVSLHRMLFSF